MAGKQGVPEEIGVLEHALAQRVTGIVHPVDDGPAKHADPQLGQEVGIEIAAHIAPGLSV